MFEKFLQLRLISIIAVISLFVGSAIMFVVGMLKTAGAFLIVVPGANSNLPAHLPGSSLISVTLIQAVDAFLFALVLLIFSYGIYILFVYAGTEEDLGKLPRWMQIRSIAGLKVTLIQVIIVILAVNVLEYVILVGPSALKWETIILPATILALAASLRLMQVPAE